MSNGLANGSPTRGTVPAHPLLDTPALLIDAVSSLYDHGIDRLLSTPDRVTSAAHGKQLLREDESTAAIADNIQRVATLAVPILRTLARGAKFTRVPWVLIATTTFSVGSAVRTGIREVQILGSLLAYRLEQATGRPANPVLVKRLTLELYLAPRTSPNASNLELPLGQLLRRWLFKGATGRSTQKNAFKALDAAERLDLGPFITR